MQKPRQAIYKLKGAIRYYDWGGTGFLSELLDRQDENKKPMAEYWLGAHHLSSSLLLTEGEAFPLKNFIEQNKEEILGRTVAKKFGGLPYLLKVLDVKDMLSIQVHPAKHEAELGF